MSEFERVSGSVATNIQKLVQNVSSMQRMMIHVDTQVQSCVHFNRIYCQIRVLSYIYLLNLLSNTSGK
jgi:hypothetical protein